MMPVRGKGHPMTVWVPCHTCRTPFPSPTIPRALSLLPGPSREAPTKKGGEKKRGHPASHEVVTREHTIGAHKHARGVGLKRRAPRALREIGNLPQRRWALQMCPQAPGWTEPSGPKEGGPSLTVSGCGCPGNIIQVKSRQTSSIGGSPAYLSPL